MLLSRTDLGKSEHTQRKTVCGLWHVEISLKMLATSHQKCIWNWLILYNFVAYETENPGTAEAAATGWSRGSVFIKEAALSWRFAQSRLPWALTSPQMIPSWKQDGFQGSEGHGFRSLIQNFPQIENKVSSPPTLLTGYLQYAMHLLAYSCVSSTSLTCVQDNGITLRSESPVATLELRVEPRWPTLPSWELQDRIKQEEWRRAAVEKSACPPQWIRKNGEVLS